MDNRQRDKENQSHNAPTDTRWKEFLNNTTLHGARNVVSSRKKLIRITWLMFLLTSGSYYLTTVYNAFDKYLQHPVTTTITMTYKTSMTFPAVTICPNNLFSKAKVMMWDDNPSFSAQGLNLSVCAATRGVRQSKMNNLTCGLAMICCCVYFGIPSEAGNYPNCTKEKRDTLRSALQQSGVNFNIEDFFWYYSADILSDVSRYNSSCTFGQKSLCSTSDFVRKLAAHGLCYTFNSGEDGKSVRNVTLAGLTGGLALMLNANYSDETIGKLSRGFKVLIHKQGQFFDDWEGISLSPGTHAVITVSEHRDAFQPYATRSNDSLGIHLNKHVCDDKNYKSLFLSVKPERGFTNLQNPYGDCKNASLKGYPIYTVEGCISECLAERAIKLCGCRMSGYTGSKYENVCWLNHAPCLLYNASDYDECRNCFVPCSLVKYRAEVSYSKFPDLLSSRWFYEDYGDIEEQSKSVTFLQVGMKTMGYEEQIQKKAYDITSLFGEIGGNMGLFLGCSVLTICEFLEFLISHVTARLCNRQVEDSPA